MGIREIPGLSFKELSADIQMGLEGSLKFAEWMESDPSEEEIAMGIIEEVVKEVREFIQKFILTPRFPTSQIGVFRPLRRDCASLRDRRVSWVV